MRKAVFSLAIALSSAACTSNTTGGTGGATASSTQSSSSTQSGSTTATSSSSLTSSTGSSMSTGSTGSASTGSNSSSSTGGGPTPPTFVQADEVCKLINNANQTDPSLNQTHTRVNLQGTDLGIPVDHDGAMYVFFGDSVGYKAIWPFGESSPDSVARALDSSPQIAAQPNLLCTDLEFLHLSKQDSAGPKADPAILADFAAPYMTPPAGHDIGEFIHNPSGTGQFKNLPGSFEVPSGAFSYNGAIYVFYTTVDSPSGLHMVSSYLAKWSNPSPTGLPNYDILYGVDERVDAAGPLGGNFINVSAVVKDNYVYLFGTGAYRQSAVYLARKALTTIDTAGGFEVFDATSNVWKQAPAAAAPIIDSPGFGETSVRFFPTLNQFMFLAEDLSSGNRITARFAPSAEGPWSSAQTILDMGDPAFLAKYCCVNGDCSGGRLFNCGKAGFYGSYLLPDALPAGSAFTVSFTLSTWDPYNVALFTASFNP